MLVIGQMSPNSVVNFYTSRWKVDWMSKHLIDYKHHHRNHLKIILPNTKQETRWRRDSLVVSSLPSFDAVYSCYTSKLQPITWWTDYLDILHSYQPELTNNLLPFWRNLLELKSSSMPDYSPTTHGHAGKTEPFNRDECQEQPCWVSPRGTWPHGATTARGGRNALSHGARGRTLQERG